MTLNIVIAAPWGMWLCTDFRVCDVDRRTGTLVPRQDHWSPKYVMVETPDGRLVLTYTGAAEVVAVEPDLAIPDGLGIGQVTRGRRRTVPVSEWLTWVLHGKTRTGNDVLHHIAVEASKHTQLCRHPHIFNAVAYLNGQPWIVDVRNFEIRQGEDPRVWMSRRPLTQFLVRGRRVDEPPGPVAFAVGGGSFSLSVDSRKLLKRVSTRRPRRPHEYMNVLAKINGQVARANAGVSPACHAVYLAPHPPPEGPIFLDETYENGQAWPSDFEPGMLTNAFGMDLYAYTRSLMRRALKQSEEQPNDEEV